MTVISSRRDPEALTLEMVAEFTAPPERVWEVFSDPRKLERWWGPPGYPATFTRHEFEVGGQARYYMTGPQAERLLEAVSETGGAGDPHGQVGGDAHGHVGGDRHHGWWRFEEIEEPSRLRFRNGLAAADGEPVPGIRPAGALVNLEPIATGTRMTVITQFVDVEQMEMMLRMGMEEGSRMAAGQIDALLEELAA